MIPASSGGSSKKGTWQGPVIELANYENPGNSGVHPPPHGEKSSLFFILSTYSILPTIFGVNDVLERVNIPSRVFCKVNDEKGKEEKKRELLSSCGCHGSSMSLPSSSIFSIGRNSAFAARLVMSATTPINPTQPFPVPVPKPTRPNPGLSVSLFLGARLTRLRRVRRGGTTTIDDWLLHICNWDKLWGRRNAGWDRETTNRATGTGCWGRQVRS
ncbi:hypothetical protein DER45DRAFT_115163 [Fusarium avenaceum]|nr:hypothetical protein DER45DRAFT_115163 [Fusarium avenaceum]